ncbi:MAG TPA: carboxypeptidase regulatory-like domain-containing protein, partial [Candidatus Sulfotelmatobacter sp.]|nr:carboxypeptidase regulatory-like domain-containing protein [Candidatus Sulfotelmatobacter sp.]
MLRLNSSAVMTRVMFVFALLATLALASSAVMAQTTVAQGSIQGTVTDPSGAVVGGAKVSITNRANGQTSSTTTSSSGTYNSGGLIPGDYVVRIEAKGFKTTTVPIVVQVAVTVSGNIKLEVGQESQVVEVQGSAVAVNTEQATVQGVLTADQIDKLPVDGRNFLDLAQLEPGVQIQDGQDFDPTKAGYSSVSINGVFGRTPRIELDGLDISDENVGTTTQNIALSSIQEFNISRSSLDLSSELTSAGAVNVATRSGSNGLHGQGFYNFRDRNALTAPFAGDQKGYYQRNNFGGRIGGPFIKDKLFWFIDAERIKQDGVAPVIVSSLPGLDGGYNSPFRDTEVTGKLDWNATKDIHVFYRFTYNWNISVSNFGYDYSVYANKDNAPSHAIGLDWNKGSWSHSIRAGYLKFHNQIAGAHAGFDPVPSGEIAFIDTGEVFSGPNLLAPQGTLQSNKQVKYDGSKVWGSHIVRFGAGVNRILGGGFASFFGLAPLDYTASGTGVGNDLTTYPLLFSILGNGQGFFTEKSQFGFPGGGQSDTRFQAYIGDSWKIRPNFTLTYGLRYNRDTGRSDSDLAPIPCSATTLVTCSGNLLDQWGAGLGNRIQNPNKNFGPQVGFAWDPAKNGKTVIRGGAGLYYENYIFNNTLFDRPAKLPTGRFFATGSLNCFGASGPGSVSFSIPGKGSVTTAPDGVDLATGVCNQPLGTSGPEVLALQQEFQAASIAAGPAANPNFVGDALTFNTHVVGAAFAPNFRTARSYQMNLGLQRQIGKGVLSADYIRNISLHFQEGIDVNHVGDSRYLNKAAAANAIATTLANCGVTTVAASYGGNCATDPATGTSDGGTWVPRPATMTDFANNGLDSGLAYSSTLGSTGSPASFFGLTPDTFAAFQGINPAMGVGEFNFPIGRSVYNGLQMSYKQQVSNPMRGVAGLDLTIAYTLSRFKGTGGNDQNFSPLAWDFRNPTGFFGPTSLDRTHQFKFGATFDIAHRGPRFSVIGNFASPAPTTLQLPTQAGTTGPGEIYLTDLTGDGTVSDLFPINGGTVGQPGQFMRGVNGGSITQAISKWNTTQAGTPTPAGQALIDG